MKMKTKSDHMKIYITLNVSLFGNNVKRNFGKRRCQRER